LTDREIWFSNARKLRSEPQPEQRVHAAAYGLQSRSGGQCHHAKCVTSGQTAAVDTLRMDYR
jgi:hypothetical protein